MHTKYVQTSYTIGTSCFKYILYYYVKYKYSISIELNTQGIKIYLNYFVEGEMIIK